MMSDEKEELEDWVPEDGFEDEDDETTPEPAELSSKDLEDFNDIGC